MNDPVAWTVIERGWKVIDAEGEEIGHVDEITGDENADIFDGLTIRHGTATKPKYVPAENVTEILDGEIHLSLSHAQVETLETYTEPIQEQILAEGSKWYQRLIWRWYPGRKR